MTKKVNEGLAELAGVVDQDHEVQMARADLYKIAKYAIKLHEMLKNVTEAEGMEGWQQAKITKAADYIGSVYHSLDYDMKAPQMEAKKTKDIVKRASESTDEYKLSLHAKLTEKAVSTAQQRAAGIALAAKKKGKTPTGKGAAAGMAKMSTKELEKFAGTKHKGLPKKKTNETLNLQAKKILGEGKEYQIYLELSEAPIGDVIGKIKSGLAKLPKNVVAKAVPLIKKIPKAKLAIAAGVLISAASSASAGSDPAALADLLQQLQTLSSDLSQGVGDLADKHGGAWARTAADTGQAAANVGTSTGADISMSQVRDAIGKLGGGTGQHVKDMLANGVDVDQVKTILDRFRVTDEAKISNAISRIEGNNLEPMIRYLGQVK